MTKKTSKMKAAASKKPGATGFGDGRFKPGPDARRCLSGSKCRDLRQFEDRFKKELARQGDVKALVQSLYRAALSAHKEWAFRVLLEYAIGKPANHIELDSTPKIYRIVYAGEGEAAVIQAQRELEGLPPLSRPDAHHPPLLAEVVDEAPAPAKPADDPDDIFINPETEEKHE